MSATLNQRTAAVMRAAFAARTPLTVSQWANLHGWIAGGSGAAESGRYSTDRAPYLAEILDVMGDEVHRDVVFNKPAQVGFTEAINQFVAYCMAEDPSGLIVIRENDDAAKGWMKERIDPMIAESPRLRGIVRSEGGRRSSDDTMKRKVFRNGWLVAVGANAPANLRSRAARRLLGDERSGWTLDARQQGDPWDLGCERTATFWNAKRIQGSTPNEEGTCPITAALAESDLRRYHVGCPACGKREPFTWKDPDGTYRLVFDRDAANQIIPATAAYLCTACGVLVPRSEHPRMLRGGAWVPTYPGRAMVGFDMNGLISPWRTWEDIGHLWLKAQDNHERLKVFVTHVLAEPWRPVAERIDVRTLMARATGPDVAPESAALCTGFLDVQGNRLETLLVAWSAEEEAHVLEWRQHDGDPTEPHAWASAWASLTRDTGVPLAAIGLDTGYLTDEVWRYVDKWGRLTRARVLGCKGMPGRGRPVMQRPGAAITKRQRRPWLIGTDTCKDMLSLRLQRPVPPGGAGALHFASTLDPVFFDQLTSEEQRTAMVANRPTKVWRLIAGRRNEALDLTVGCLAALYALGPNVVAQLGALAERAREQRRAPEGNLHGIAPTTTATRARRVRHAGISV